ncbi:hypothetical protein [Streptomyces sparsus]
MKTSFSRIAAVAAASVLAAAFLHASTNTNLLGDDRFCDGLLSADDVRTAFGGPGRFTGEQQGPSHCRIERSNLGFGDDGAVMSLSVVAERKRFPLSPSQWEAGADVRMTSGGEGIGVRKDGGWAVLPVECELDDQPEAEKNDNRPVLKASVREGSADPLGLARLLATMRTSWTEQAECAPTGTEREPATLQPATGKQRTDPSRVCSLPGFTIAASGREPVATQEQTSGSIGSDWFCDVTLKDSNAHTAEDDHYVRFAAVRTPELVAGRDDNDPEVKCEGKPIHLIVDTINYPVDEAESAEQGVVEEVALFQRFVDAVAEQQGCARS